jgi:DNA-binding transcriptional regulator YiaG
VSETPAKTAPTSVKARKKTKARRARKKAAGQAKKKTLRKKKTAKKTLRKKAAGQAKKKTLRKKKTAKKAASKATTKTKKKTRKAGPSRGGRRAPQGRRLGGWELVGHEEVFSHLKATGTTIATLARTLDVGPSAVHAWKAGRRYPSEQAQLKLRQMLSGELTPAAAPKGKKAKGKKAKGKKARAFSGKAFRKLREERGLSRARLSKQLGVSAGSIRNWEAGVSRPRGTNLAKVLEFLAVAPAPSAPSRATAPQGSAPSGNGSEAAVLGAAQVASAYLAAGHTMLPKDVVQFVTSLRGALS